MLILIVMYYRLP